MLKKMHILYGKKDIKIKIYIYILKNKKTFKNV